MVTPVPTLPQTYAALITNFYCNLPAFEACDDEEFLTLLNTILNHISQCIFIANADFEVIAVNQQFANLVGYPAVDLLGKMGDLAHLTHYSADHHELFVQSQQRLENLESIDDYITFPTHDGKLLYLHLQIFPYVNPKNFIQRLYIGLLTDVTTHISTKKELKRALYFDKLTGLKNRYAIDTALSNLLNTDNLTSSLVIAIHIDRLYTFNQSIGREATDNLIKNFVTRIEGLSVSGCVVHTFSRLSGNDFCLVLKIDELANGYDYLDKLSQAFELPFLMAGQKMYLRLSIGVVHFPDDATTSEMLLTHAETAVQKARLSGGDSIVWYKDISQISALFSKIHLESALSQALTRQEFVPFYQPKLSFTQDDSYLFEALVRWQHPDLGLLSPQEFIDTLLDAHLDQKLFESIVKSVIADINIWQQQGFYVQVSINADVQQLVNPEFIQFMRSIMIDQPNIPRQLEIEITEINRIIDEKTAKATLNQLREWGFRIALDDFGTGFASLSYLSNYQFDVVKIDQSFIQDMMQNAKKQQIVKHMIALAHDLDIQAYAEGVENFAQHQFLARVGCDGTQGFLYGKPMSSEATNHWLKMQTSSRLD